MSGRSRQPSARPRLEFHKRCGGIVSLCHDTWMCDRCRKRDVPISETTYASQDKDRT